MKNRTVKEILAEVNPTIYKRGLNLYQSKCVNPFKMTPYEFTGYVYGETNDYEYKIQFDNSGHVTYLFCECPYQDTHEVCKHLVAVLLLRQAYENDDTAHMIYNNSFLEVYEKPTQAKDFTKEYKEALQKLKLDDPDLFKDILALFIEKMTTSADWKFKALLEATADYLKNIKAIRFLPVIYNNLQTKNQQIAFLDKMASDDALCQKFFSNLTRKKNTTFDKVTSVYIKDHALNTCIYLDEDMLKSVSKLCYTSTSVLSNIIRIMIMRDMKDTLVALLTESSQVLSEAVDDAVFEYLQEKVPSPLYNGIFESRIKEGTITHAELVFLAQFLSKEKIDIISKKFRNSYYSYRLPSDSFFKILKHDKNAYVANMTYAEYYALRKTLFRDKDYGDTACQGFRKKVFATLRGRTKYSEEINRICKILLCNRDVAKMNELAHDPRLQAMYGFTLDVTGPFFEVLLENEDMTINNVKLFESKGDKPCTSTM